MAASHRLEVDGSGRPRREYKVEDRDDVPKLMQHLEAALHELLDHKHGVVLNVRAMNEAQWERMKRLNAMCGDMAKQAQWYGNKLNKDEWKHLVCAIVRKDQRQVPGESGFGFIMLGGSSRDLTRDEWSLAIEMLFWLGAERKVVWSDPKTKQLQEAYVR